MPGVAHDLQRPVQAEEQQTPSTQNALRHSADMAQVRPVDFLQFPLPSQTSPPTLQAELIGVAGFDGVPLMLHTSFVH